MSDQIPLAFQDMQRLIDTTLEEFVESCKTFGEPLHEMARMVKEAFLKLRDIILYSSQYPCLADMPTNHELAEIFEEITQFRNRNRHVAEFNHLSTVSESVAALNWINVKPAPASFIHDMIESGEYFGNRVLQSNKGSPVHLNFVRKWYAVLRELEQFVRRYYLTGLSCGSPSIRAHTAPPPPPPPFIINEADLGPSTSDDLRHALLNDLNQGVGIVNRLRHVNRASGAPPSSAITVTRMTPDESSSIAFGDSRSGIRRSAPRPTSNAAKFLLDGKKWRVEHQRNNTNLQIESEDMSHSVAMFDCEGSCVVVKNKVNGVVIDTCRSSSLVLNDIISSLEVIRCDRVKIQCEGHIPLISMDNSDSIQIFLKEKSRDVEIISAKSASCNVCTLEADGDYKEYPVPEQIKTVLVEGRLRSVAVDKN